MNLPGFLSKSWPEFVDKATSFFDKAQTPLSSPSPADTSGDVEAHKASLADAEKEIADLKASILATTADFHALQIKHAALDREYTELKAKETDIEKRASNRALEITSAIGIKPVASIPTGNSESLLEQYIAIDAQKEPAKKTEFWRKHKAQLIKLRNK